MQDSIGSLGRDTFIWAVGSLCALHRVPFDADLLLRRFPPPYDLTALQQAAIAYDFKVALQETALQNLHDDVYPVIAVLKPAQENKPEGDVSASAEQAATSVTIDKPNAGLEADDPQHEATQNQDSQNEASQEPLPNQLAVILKADAERVLMLKLGDQTPATLSHTEYQDIATGQIILATRKEEKIREDGIIAKPTAAEAEIDKKPFGFRWFIPEILKHKNSGVKSSWHHSPFKSLL